MAGFGQQEARINRERRAQVSVCGDCGTEVKSTELLCIDCRGTMPAAVATPR